MCWPGYLLEQVGGPASAIATVTPLALFKSLLFTFLVPAYRDRPVEDAVK